MYKVHTSYYRVQTAEDREPYSRDLNIHQSKYVAAGLTYSFHTTCTYIRTPSLKNYYTHAALHNCARCTVQGDDSSTPLPTCFLCPPLRMLALCGCCQVPRRQLRLPWQPEANIRIIIQMRSYKCRLRVHFDREEFIDLSKASISVCVHLQLSVCI